MEEKTMHWAAVWGNAVSIAEHRPESFARNITLRYPIDIPFSGDALRFTFDNYCGSESVTITKATVSLATCNITEKVGLSCPISADTVTDITFSDEASVTISAHERVVSDAVSFSVSDT